MALSSRPFGAALAALALTTALGACGSATSGSPTGSSPSGTPAPDQVSVTVGDEVDLTDALAASAAAMKAKKTYSFTGEAAGAAMSGQMRVDGDGTAMTIQTTVQGAKVDMLLVDGVMYIGGFPHLPPGKTFVKIDPEGEDPMSKMMGPMLSQMAEAADPTASLAGITALKAEVIEVKDGTTTYEVSVSVDQQLAIAKERLAVMGMGDTPLPTPAMKPLIVRQTIGPDDLPTRTELVGGADLTLNLTYSGWGEPVDVVAPPADKVTTFADVM
ncbi:MULTISPECIES: hypothetical protein [unclassified Knoellia]|uniref:hypothetical protein n=1 Tax=Knoellia altitudinis TaxID=3404795 RepID=UPI00361B9F32